MMEREPSFEDDKIRTWAARPEEGKVEQFEGDPTVLSLDIEREEIYESRTYRFRENPETFSCLADLVASRQGEVGLELSLEEVLGTAAELMADTIFKFLAKRRKEDGLISSLLVGITPGGRQLLAQQEWVQEGDYRRAVRDFEAESVGKELLSEPLVVTLEEWRRYEEEGPFSEKKG